MIKRRIETAKNRRPLRCPKKSETIYNSTLLYLKFVLVWGGVLLADFMLGVRFEYLWPVWLFLQSVHDTYKYQGLAFSLFFSCLSLTSDIICSYAIKDDWIFFLASSYVWVQYVWHTERGVCLPTIVLWFLFVWVEAAVRLKDISKDMSHRVNLCRPFAAHSIGYPVVTLGFGFKSYITYKLRLRKQSEVQKENDFYFQLLKRALPQQTLPFDQYPLFDEEPRMMNGHVGQAGITNQPTISGLLGNRGDTGSVDRTTTWVQNHSTHPGANGLTHRPNVVRGNNTSNEAETARSTQSTGVNFSFWRSSRTPSIESNLNKHNQINSTGSISANKGISGYANPQANNPAVTSTATGHIGITQNGTVVAGSPSSTTQNSNSQTAGNAAVANQSSHPKIPDTMRTLAHVFNSCLTPSVNASGEGSKKNVGESPKSEESQVTVQSSTNVSAVPSTGVSISTKSSQSNKRDAGNKKVGGSNSGANTGRESRKQRANNNNSNTGASNFNSSNPDFKSGTAAGLSMTSSSISNWLEPNNNHLSSTSIVTTFDSLTDTEKLQKMEELDILVKSLSADLSAKGMINQELQSKNQEFQSKITSLSSTERHSKQEIEQLKNEKKELEKRITDLSLQKVAANSKVETLEMRLESEKKGKVDAEKRAQEEKHRAKRTVEEELTKFMSDIVKKNECTSSNCSKRSKDLELEKNQLQVELVRKSERMLNMEQELETLRVLRDDLAEKSKEIARVQELNSRLESNLSMENKYKMDLFSALNECNRKINSFQIEIGQKNKEIYELQIRAASFGASNGTGDRYSFMSMNGPSQNIPSIHSSNVSNGMQQHPSMQQSSQLHESPPNIMTSPPGSAQAFYLPAQIQQPQVTRNSPINLSNLNPEAIAYNPVSHPAAVVSSGAPVGMQNGGVIQTSGAGMMGQVISMGLQSNGVVVTGNGGGGVGINAGATVDYHPIKVEPKSE